MSSSFFKYRPSPALVIALIAMFLVGGGTAVAGSTINGKSIKKKSIPLSALSPAAIKALKGGGGPAGPAGTPGPAGASAAKYWAYVTSGGPVGRGTPGVSASLVTNGGINLQYQVKFPADITQCAYQVTSGDTSPISQNDYVSSTVPAVSRSNVDANTLAVHLWKRNSAYNSNFVSDMHQDSFFITVFC